MELREQTCPRPSVRAWASEIARKLCRRAGDRAGERSPAAVSPPDPVWLKLGNGQAVCLRAITRRDRKPLREEVFLKLSLQSLRNRFLALKRDLTADELNFLCDVDFIRHFAIVAEVESGAHRRLVGVARYLREDENSASAEIALAVVDDFQSMGIGTELLHQLVSRGRERGVVCFQSVMLAHNQRMTKLIRKIGVPRTSSYDGGIVSMSLEL